MGNQTNSNPVTKTCRWLPIGKKASKSPRELVVQKKKDYMHVTLLLEVGKKRKHYNTKCTFRA